MECGIRRNGTTIIEPQKTEKINKMVIFPIVMRKWKTSGNLETKNNFVQRSRYEMLSYTLKNILSTVHRCLKLKAYLMFPQREVLLIG